MARVLTFSLWAIYTTCFVWVSLSRGSSAGHHKTCAGFESMTFCFVCFSLTTCCQVLKCPYVSLRVAEYHRVPLFGFLTVSATGVPWLLYRVPW